MSKTNNDSFCLQNIIENTDVSIDTTKTKLKHLPIKYSGW